jgi:hypothetical protein
LSAEDTSDHKPVFHYENGVPVFDPQRLDDLAREQEDAKKRDEKYKDDQLTVNRRMMIFTAVLAGCSILGSGISAWQAHTANVTAGAAKDNATAATGMVEEMKKSGNDTHELAVQAKNQADRTKDVADRALLQANATNELARQAKRSADANKEAADAAKSAATIAASQLELTERPWVDAAITPDGPFDFNENGANIHLKFQLRNTGHSPALMAVIEAEPVDSAFTEIGDPMQHRDRACRAADATIQKYPIRGVAVFPNNSVETSWTYTFSTEELAKHHGKGSTMPSLIVWPSVVVCIGYRPPFSQTIYHTSYIFLLRRVDASNRISATFKIGEDVPREQLRLILSDENPINAD